MHKTIVSSILFKFLTAMAIIALAFAAMPVQGVQAAHTFDTSVRFTGNANPLTQSYTVGSGGTLLVLSIVTQGNAARAGGAPTFNGVAFTQAASTRIANETVTELWYLLSPPTGSAYTISIPNATGPRNLFAIASSYKAQTGYTSAFDVANGNVATGGGSANPSVSVTTTVDGDTIVAAMGNGNNTAPTADSGTTLFSVDDGNFSDSGQYSLQGTAGAIAMSWTVAVDDWGVVVAAFKEVPLTPTTTTITADTPEPSVIGGTVNVTVTVAGGATPTGTVDITGADTNCSITLAGGTGSCNVTFTSVGAKILTATYNGDGTHATSSATEPHTVNAAATTTTITSDLPDPSVVGQSVTVNYSVAVTPPGAGTPTGNVTVSDGTDSCTATVAAGTCSITFTSAGTKSLTATYTGDANFNTSASAAEAHTVNAANTTTTITSDLPDPSVVGQSVTVNYSVAVTSPGAGTPTGNVTVSDGTDSCTATVAAGTCSITFTSAGAKTLTATYAGDVNFNGSTSSAENHTVNASDTTTAITSDLPDPSVVGESVTVDYSVAVTAPGVGTPTGNVTVSDGTDSCTATVAAGTCSFTFTSAGAKTLTATYAGDVNFNGSVSAGEAHTVNTSDTTTTITSDLPEPSLVGQSVSVNYSVSVNAPGTGKPTGNVTVSDGTDSCTATVAVGTCSITFTSAGAKTLTATYASDANFNGSTSAGEAHTVNASATTTTITSDLPDPSVVGESVTVNYSVAVTAPGVGTPTGNVTVSDGTDSCTGTVAAGTCSMTFTSAGAKTLTATYAGDVNFNTSTSATEAHTINAADTTTAITSDLPDPSLVGQSVTVNYSVAVTAPGVGTPTGNVTVSDGIDSCTATVAAGTCSITFTTTGAKTLSATYAGDANFNGSISAGEAHTIVAPTIIVSPATLPNGTVGAAYSQTITASGGTAPYSFAVTAGALPAGLSLSSAGVLSGTPTAGGTFNFTVTATDSSGTGPYTGSQAYSLIIGAPTIAVSPATLPDGTLTFAYSQNITASGGTAPYSFAVTAGTLPAGLSLSSAGVLSGTPTASGPFDFTVTVTDSSTGTGAPYTGSRAYSVTINVNTTVTINQAVGQADPANLPPIAFTVVFSSAVTGFVDVGDVTLSGTANPSTAVITPITATTYTVSVTGMTADGTIVATIPAGAALDGASLPTAASTSIDNTVTYDSSIPSVTGSTPVNNGTAALGLTQLTVRFSEDVKNDGSAGAANNTANYLLVEDGANSIFNTLTCLGGAVADDTQITFGSASYTNNGGSGPFVATLTVSSLPVGTYRLFVCGTTSIEDLNGTELNNGLSDAQINFSIVALRGGTGGGTGGGNIRPTPTFLIPVTGFPMNQVTTLPIQPADKVYSSTDMWLEIPKLGVQMSIVGVPGTMGAWDVTWLGRNAGWLNGSAYPTWNGNSVITGHVWDALNRPGPFAKLKDLKYGDQIKIHAFGNVYVYEIRSTELVSPTRSTTAFKHEEKPWLTLITCEDYNELTDTYLSRRMLKAVLINVSEEK